MPHRVVLRAAPPVVCSPQESAQKGSMMKRFVVGFLGLFLPLLLQAAPGYAPADPTGLSEPATVLCRGIETLTGYLEYNRGMPPVQLRQFLESEIVPYFDFQRMAYWSAGSLNRYLTQQQRQRLTWLLKARFLNAMVEQLGRYRQGRLQYLPPRGNPIYGEVTLGVRVFGVDAYPMQLDFRLYRGPQGWKVYDVMANGASAVAHYRNEFAWLARRHGIEGLLVGLQP
jgi:phospholipid transport system substrate-binding protein